MQTAPAGNHQKTTAAQGSLRSIQACSLSPLACLTAQSSSANTCSKEAGKARHSQFNLLAEASGQGEAHEALPLLRRADAVVRQLLHGHPVDALRVTDPVVHLGSRQENENRKASRRNA